MQKEGERRYRREVKCYEGTKTLLRALALTIPTLSLTFSFSSTSATLMMGLVTLEPGNLPTPGRVFAEADGPVARCSSAVIADDTRLLGSGVPVGEKALDGSVLAAFVAFEALGVGEPAPLALDIEVRRFAVEGGAVGPLAEMLVAAKFARVPLLRAEGGREATDGGRSMDCLRSWVFLALPSVSERTERGAGVLSKICESRRFEVVLDG
jgi:hypothetical protein